MAVKSFDKSTAIPTDFAIVKFSTETDKHVAHLTFVFWFLWYGLLHAPNVSLAMNAGISHVYARDLNCNSKKIHHTNHYKHCSCLLGGQVGRAINSSS